MKVFLCSEFISSWSLILSSLVISVPLYNPLDLSLWKIGCKSEGVWTQTCGWGCSSLRLGPLMSTHPWLFARCSIGSQCCSVDPPHLYVNSWGTAHSLESTWQCEQSQEKQSTPLSSLSSIKINNGIQESNLPGNSRFKWKQNSTCWTSWDWNPSRVHFFFNFSLSISGCRCWEMSDGYHTDPQNSSPNCSIWQGDSACETMPK